MTGESHELGPLGPLVGYHLRRASGAFAADFSNAVDGTGMRQVLVGILAVVSRGPGINQGAVGRTLGIKRANMVSLINELVELKLIERLVDPSDRRAFALTLTDAGRDMLDSCLARIKAHERAMMSEFTAEERDKLIELLGRIDRRPV